MMPFSFLKFALHAHTDTDSVWGFIDSVFIDGILDTLKIVPFLFLTYLFMEFIEHKASDKISRLMKKAGALGPLAGGLLGAIPQCGFSAAAANLYTGRVVSLGTLIAVFLSTSDEMLPMMIAGNVSVKTVLLILGYKTVLGIAVGLLTDLILRLTHRSVTEINIDQICDEDNCHCERGILRSALHHTMTVGGFVLIITLLINLAVTLIGAENIASVTSGIPILSHLICALIGLIPNCASSVLLTDLCLEGLITVGTMMSGLFSGAGVGILILIKVNKKPRENLFIISLLVVLGTLLGLVADLIGFPSLI